MYKKKQITASRMQKIIAYKKKRLDMLSLSAVSDASDDRCLP